MPFSSIRRVALAVLAASALTALAFPAQACTSFRVQSQDGAWIVARSMEFEMDLKSQVMLVPRGHPLTATRPDLKPGTTWTAKHGFLGFNALGMDIAADGSMRPDCRSAPSSYPVSPSTSPSPPMASTRSPTSISPTGC